ncbi:hypothetical protein C8R47DRAFT_1262660, partial [Mycena vitilis]
DNSSSPPPSYSPAAEEPCSPLVTIVASIPPTIARTMFVPRPCEFHGLPFDMLPPEVQSFLSSHGLDNAAQYDSSAVAAIRLWLTDRLVDTANPMCEELRMARGVLRYLANADALVWADVAAREAVSLEDACWYRWLQTQPAIEIVDRRLADLYEWVAAMWMKGRRLNGRTTLSEDINNLLNENMATYFSPALVAVFRRVGDENRSKASSASAWRCAVI